MPPWICTAWWVIHIAASEAVSLATAASVLKRLPWPFTHAARRVSSRAASSLHFMSAILAWVIRKVPMAAPKALRSFTYSRVAS
ncbi:hypothetical protein G6F32_017401 [Rhizopus arrhizus]|nr:hypothetical protein G6F32_017401 [Rhizopus arrhizus]